MVTSDTAPESVPEMPAEGAAESQVAPTARADAGTPVWVWVVYALGCLAGVVFALSVLFVAVAAATNGDGGSGVNISVPAFAVWLGLMIAALGTFVWRRYGGPR